MAESNSRQVGVMTLMSPRTKSSHYLAFLLSALMVCPANPPSFHREGGTAELPSPESSIGREGPSWHKPERQPTHPSTTWSVDADDLETSCGRDDLRIGAIEFPRSPLDGLVLIPSSLDRQPLGPHTSEFPPIQYHPLRC